MFLRELSPLGSHVELGDCGSRDVLATADVQRLQPSLFPVAPECRCTEPGIGGEFVEADWRHGLQLDQGPFGEFINNVGSLGMDRSRRNTRGTLRYRTGKPLRWGMLNRRQGVVR